ncbi:MAG: hypothetical protein Q8K18_19620 [Burkholderiales bacterium]|nr:hypothetical protein [Burkholderiales bacterium]
MMAEKPGMIGRGDRVQPILSLLAADVTHTGPSGSGAMRPPAGARTTRAA